MKQTCHGKRSYGKEEARRVKKYREERGSEWLRVYECPVCHGWHLTSKMKFK